MILNHSIYQSDKIKTSIVIDRGASRSISPNLLDLIAVAPIVAPIQGPLATTRIKCIGKVRWHIRVSKGTSISIETKACRISSFGQYSLQYSLPSALYSICNQAL